MKTLNNTPQFYPGDEFFEDECSTLSARLLIVPSNPVITNVRFNASVKHYELTVAQSPVTWFFDLWWFIDVGNRILAKSK